MHDIRVFDPAEELIHAPDGDPSWQESALFVWYDTAGGIGGFWRLGQEVEAGAINSCFAVFTDDGLRFRSNVTGVSLGAADRGAAHMSWGDTLRVDLDRLAITARFPDCEADLRFADFYPRFDWIGSFGTAETKEQLTGHFEVAGRITGRIRLGEREIMIDALGYRDRSWGPRRWGKLRATRWWPAVFGPDLTVHLFAGVTETGTAVAVGHAVRDGMPMMLHDVDIDALMAYDALTPRMAMGRFAFDEGAAGELRHAPADGVLMHVRGYTAVESIGRVHMGTRVGMSLFEISSNAAGGTAPPAVVFGANMKEGLIPFCVEADSGWGFPKG